MPQEPPQPMTVAQKVDGVMTICAIIAAPIEAVLHRPGTSGCKAFSGGAAAGTLALFIAAQQDDDPNVSCVVLGIVVFCILLHRLYSPAATHSRYSGQSWLPFSEGIAKRWAEPFGLIAVGFVLWPAHPGLGIYLMTAAWSLAALDQYAMLRLRAIARANADARVEQEIMREIMRRGA